MLEIGRVAAYCAHELRQLRSQPDKLYMSQQVGNEKLLQLMRKVWFVHTPTEVHILSHRLRYHC